MMPQSSLPAPDEALAGGESPAGVRRERLRFAELRVQRSPSGKVRAEVELEWTAGKRITGSHDGHASPQGELRIAASAALHALEEFVGAAMRFELLGIRAVRAFDTSVVVAAVSVRHRSGSSRLVGCAIAEEQPVRAAVLAVLSATNRLLGNFITPE